MGLNGRIVGRSLYLSRCQSRCVFSGPVVLVFCLFGFVSVASLHAALVNSHTGFELQSIDWSENIKTEGKYGPVFQFLSILLFGTSSFISVWLTSWKYQLQSVVTMGLFLLFPGVIINVVVSLAISATRNFKHSVWAAVLDYTSFVLVFLGLGSIIPNVLQLAIEQFPDASSSQLSALVSWFLFVNYVSGWLYSSSRNVFLQCITSEDAQREYIPVLKVIVLALLAVCTCLYLIYKHKLLDNSPTSSTAIKLYRVLRYAYQHKFPERRSAFTYWEDKPTSRLNHGKMKYGGPFTSEDVEDVRSFIWISVLLLTFYICALPFFILGNVLSLFDFKSGTNQSLEVVDYLVRDQCENSLLLSFTGRMSWWALLFTISYELLLVPICLHRMPSIIRRLSVSAFACAFIVVAESIVLLVLGYSSVAGHFYLIGLHIGVSFVSGTFTSVLYISLYEFIYAQSPYSMRNYFIGVSVWSNWCCVLLSGAIFNLWKSNCTSQKCLLVSTILLVCLCLFGLLLFNISLKCYRKRSRGQEDEHQQIWVEEAYGKYIAEYSNN